MSKLSETQRKWLEELGAMGGGGGAMSALSLAPTEDKSSATAGFPPPAPEPDFRTGPIAAAMGEQSVQLADSARGGSARPGGGKPGGPPPTATSKSPPKQAKGTISLEVVAVEPVNESLPKQAKAIRLSDGRTQFDFGRAITKEQAAQLLFVDGKVPSGAKLVQGPGKNSWTVETPDLETQQATVKKMRARTEDVDTGKPDEFTITWDDGSKKEPEQKKKPGFWVNKKYDLDTGQLPYWLVRENLHRSEGAVGYEVVFEKAMTKDEVMEKLFIKNAPTDHIILVPMGGDPTTLWIVQVVGLVARTSFKRSVSSAFAYDPTNAFAHDPKIAVKKSTPPGVPEGMRQHIENKTVPKNAVKHAPDVYAWEEAGYLARVETDAAKGGGKYYNFETTKIAHGDKRDQEFMRDLVIKKGKRPKEAWELYYKVLAGNIKARAAEFPGGMPGGRIGGGPRGGPVPEPRIKSPPRGGKVPPGTPTGSSTIVAHPPPMPKPPGGAKPGSLKPAMAEPPVAPKTGSVKPPVAEHPSAPAKPSTDPGKAKTPNTSTTKPPGSGNPGGPGGRGGGSGGGSAGKKDGSAGKKSGSGSSKGSSAESGKKVKMAGPTDPKTPTDGPKRDSVTGGGDDARGRSGGPGKPADRGSGSGSANSNPSVEQLKNRARELSRAEDELGRDLNNINQKASDLIGKEMGIPSVKGKGPPNPVRTNPKPDKRLANIGETERNLRTIRDNPGTYGKEAADKAKGYLDQIHDIHEHQADIQNERSGITHEINNLTGKNQGRRI